MIQFTVYATPIPQGSMKGFVLAARGGRKARAILTSDNPKTVPFRTEVSACAINAMRKAGIELPMAVVHVPVELHLAFTFAKPKSVPKKRKHMVVKPDIDKLKRSCMDALKGIVYADDAQVIRGSQSKDYGPVDSVTVTARIVS